MLCFAIDLLMVLFDKVQECICVREYRQTYQMVKVSYERNRSFAA